MASGTISGTTSNQYITVRAVWSSTKNESANNSSVSVTLQARKSSSSSDATSVTATWYLVINGQTTSVHKKITVNPNNSWVTIMSTTKTVAHNTDGKKTITISAKSKADTSDSSWQSTSLSGSAVLDNIPRQTKATFNVSSAYFGDTITITLNRASSEFYHKLAYTWNGTTTTIATNVGTSYTWTIPISLITAIPNSAQASLSIVVTTYRANGSVVGTATSTITCKVPDSVGPIISSIAVSDTGTAIPASWGVYASGKSVLHVVATASAQYGASVAKYKIESGGQVTNSNDSDVGVIYSSGDIDIIVTVTDSRGISSTRTFTEALEVYNYSNPQIDSLSIVRANVNGTPVDNGTYASVDLSCSVSYLGEEHNTMTVRIKHKQSTSQTGVWTLDAELTPDSPFSTSTPLLLPDFDKSTTYDFRIEVEDYFHLSYVELQLAAEGAIISWMDGGIGIAFGKSAELRDTADFAWKIHGWQGAELDVPLGVASGGTGAGNAEDAWTALGLASSDYFTLVKNLIADVIYPVGSIYMSVDSTSPATLFGGTWVQIKNRFLLACSDTYEAGETGGAKQHAIPAHSHRSPIGKRNGNTAIALDPNLTGDTGTFAATAKPAWSASSNTTKYTDVRGYNTTSDGSHTVPTMPPYLAVYIWKRTE